MKVILSMAMSVNGIIADEDGSEDFFSYDNWIAFTKLANKIGSYIWGRKTYEAVIKWEGDYLDDLKDVTKIVISKQANLQLDPRFIQAKSPEEALNILQKRGKKEALITGGPTLNSSFLKQGLVDELILTIEPVLLGKGVPLLSPVNVNLRLKLIKVENLAPDHLAVHYAVENRF